MRLKTNNNEEKYKKQEHMAFVSFLAEVSNFVFEIISAFTAHSILVIADCFASAETTAHALIVLLVSKKMRKETGDKYNFGVERLEVVISFICDLLVVVGYTVLFASAVYQIFHISPPSSVIGLFLILKTSNTAFDVVFLVQQGKIKKKNNSRLNQTEFAKVRNNLINDVATFVLVLLSFLFIDYKWSWYIAPIATVFLSVLFIAQCIMRIRKSFSELTDFSATIKNQDKIFDTVLEYKSNFDKINEVNCRYLNAKLYVEIDVDFPANYTYENQKNLLENIENDIRKDFEDCFVRFVIQKDE